MTAVLAGIGSAVPDGGAEQDELWDGFFSRHFAGNRIARRLFESAGVRRRSVVANPLHEDVSGWTTGARMHRYAQVAPELGARAVAAALDDAAIPADEAGMFAVATCTGYATPGVDIRIAAELGMRDDVQRLLIGHMGCYAAVPALGGGADFVIARGRTAVVLCLELTSLHLQPSTADTDQIVSHALFGDAAVAVVLRPARPRTGELALADVTARTDPGTTGHMTWDITDAGFRMGLSPAVPDVLGEHLVPVVDGLLARNGLSRRDVHGWAVHPGGPRILDTAENALQLGPSALVRSREVLAQHGNCSSATLPLIVERMVRCGEAGSGNLVALAFGPGLTLYAALLRAGS
ncbi:type III polyketide synthase [Saccharopolyspora montiporae]|uniref:type III polyketide synthase n=1 Tax=Saccharopolyspora montiporae TaxID=2781240 RepID=UPI00351BF54B